jgi:hypothetical protein
MLLPKHSLLFCAFALVVLTAAGLTIPHPAQDGFGIGYGTALQAFVCIACLQGIVYFFAVTIMTTGMVFDPPPFPRHAGESRHPRLSLNVSAGRDEPKSRPPGIMPRAEMRLSTILAVAFLLRLMVLVFPPFLSNDMYRYIWDGWVQLAGINPYRYIPDDPHLAFLRDAVVFPNINRAAYAHTIYPPAAQIFFLISDTATKFLHLPPVLGMKLAMVGIESIGIWAMLRLLDIARLPRTRILIYAWNPLPIWEFAGNGHVDAIAVGFCSLALLAVCARRPGFGAAALAAATLAKFLPVVLVPALWRREKKFAAVFAAMTLLLYLPYLGVGTKVFGFLGGYAAQENISSGQGIFLLSLINLAIPAIGAKLYLAALALVLAAIAATMLRPATLSAVAVSRRCLLLGGVLMLGISPHYPWYSAFLLVPAAVAPSPAILYLATASFLLYLNPTHTELLFPSLVFGPAAALAAWDFFSPHQALAPAHPGAKI